MTLNNSTSLDHIKYKIIKLIYNNTNSLSKNDIIDKLKKYNNYTKYNLELEYYIDYHICMKHSRL
jgi:hypothetical protein